MSKLIELVDQQDWKGLFIEELGWSKPSMKALTVALPNESEEYDVELLEVAQYKGVRVWVCQDLLDLRTQRFIDRRVSKESAERLLIFASEYRQEWRWPQTYNAEGRGKARLVTHVHEVGRRNYALEQRLRMISIGLNEQPSVLDILRRLRAAFDADRVTKSFYDRFKKQHELVAREIEGFPPFVAEKTDQDRKSLNHERKWYSSLLLNRLMFIYFLQRKGLMAGDLNYLKNRLEAVQARSGRDRFFEFYSDFLVPLFHDGLGESGMAIDDPTIRELIGDIPYINGGIFSVHELELKHPSIHIDDSVFHSIFDLFDLYQWHLDDRPLGNPNEINPDVLGHIFEQFINQKQMGAYYTKEDVTEFMTASTLLPVFLERVECQLGVNPWSYVASEPSRYIWEALAHGIDAEDGFPRELELERDAFPRPSWNEKADPRWGLPGETWWEVERRHEKYADASLAGSRGEFNSVDSAVSANLDLELLSLDVLDGLDSPSDVVDAWRILTELKVVDPTCGSGAFLFAALKLLQILYGAILDAARSHAITSGDRRIAALLEDVDRHPNQNYFILKHASLHNLYGVDIMKEATEIARLRLFLKLASAIDVRGDLEPLPDLDFNIKSGNILVGAVSAEDIVISADLLTQNDIVEQATAAATVVEDAYNIFREVSSFGNDGSVRSAKKALVSALASARLAINRTYFDHRKLDVSLIQWVRSHVPFHWFIEFPEVFASGGFDVVVGNPPYVPLSKVSEYRFGGLVTAELPDIYAPCTERASQITSGAGRMALILPISSQFGSDYSALRGVLEGRFNKIWVSTFSRNPAALFSAGLGVRSSIVIGAGSGRAVEVWTTKTHRWVDDYRPYLFDTLSYTLLGSVRSQAGWVRCDSPELVELFGRLSTKPRLAQLISKSGSGRVGFKSIVLYWVSVFLEAPPSYTLSLQPTPQTGISWLKVRNERDAKIAMAILASKFAFVWWWSTSDDFHATSSGLASTPIDVGALSNDARTELVACADKLISSFSDHVQFTKYAGKWMGNFVLSEMRQITDEIDLVLANAFDYRHLLPALEGAYYAAYKPTGERNGTLRFDPSVQAAGGERS